MNPDKTRSRKPGAGSRIRFSLVSFFSLVALVLGVCVLASGCRKPPRSPATDKGQNEAKGDPWEGAAKRLKKETEPLSCKAALSELNRELATHDDVPKP